MGRLIEKRYAETLASSAWLLEILSPFDVVAVLSAKLGSSWDVEREIDPKGELSIVVLPSRFNPAGICFVFYEHNGLVHVATISGDAWTSSQEYPSCQRAVSAIVAASALVHC